MDLAATCEDDFTKLQNLFAVSGGFGPNNRVSVSIDTSIAAKGAEGRNGGYVKGDGKTQIQIVPFAGDPNAAAAVRAVFVAEMSEIFMTYRNTLPGINKAWIANDSTGEALSTICEAELHPEGYYPPSPVGAPRIGPWLNAPEITPFRAPYIAWRPNYIDRTDPTDRNQFSYACGILFINFLRYQLGFSLTEIIAKGGPTLKDTFRNLTGRDDGWNEFNQLLSTFFPIGLSYSPQTDNLFPLPQLASLEISPDTVFAGESSNGTVTLSTPHPGAPLTVNVASDSGYASLLSPNVVIPQNQNSASFLISTPPLTLPFPPATVTIIATLNGVTATATLTVKSRVNAGILKSVDLHPALVTSGQSAQGTVTLEAPAPSDTLVDLAAVETGALFPEPGDASSVAAIRKSPVTVKAGATTAGFFVDTSAVPPHVKRTATILAHAVVSKSAQLTIEGA